MKTHTETTHLRCHTYTLHLGGVFDGVNTRDPVGYSPFEQAFEPNKYLRLENTGTTDVVNPWIVVNGKRNWRSLAHILEEILSPGMSESEKARAIWLFACSHRFHYTCGTDEVKDTVKMLNCYGYTLCWDEAYTVSNLWQAAGLKIRRGYPHGHCTTEVYYEGAYHLLDSDEHLLYLLADNVTIASEEDLSRDHDLVKRGHPYGITLEESRERAEGTASAFFHTGSRSGTRPQLTSHRMDFTLRPNEALIWEWEDRGKFHGYWDRPRRLANGRMHYRPDLSAVDAWAACTDNLVGTEHGIQPIHGDRDAHLDLSITSPYVIVGGTLKLTRTSHGPMFVALSRHGEPFHPVWQAEIPAEDPLIIPLDPYFPANSPASYSYEIRIGWRGGHPLVALTDLTLETDLQMAPLSLPALEVGHNTVAYSAETEGTVRITHAFEESESIPVPAAPLKPIFPTDGADVSGTLFSFTWPEVAGATDYHIQVGALPDMAYTLSPVFNKLTSKTPAAGAARWQIPSEGLLNPDQTYYWRVRPRIAGGLWGPWSDIWSFVPKSPGVPLHVETCPDWESRTLMLRWIANPNGSFPDHYEVYGSDERGFTASREPYRVVVGNQDTQTFPANLIASTKDTSIQVAGHSVEKGNHAYYRVVAVDREGVRSGPSDLAEAPRPMIVSRPSGHAVVGKPYSYSIRALASLGDLRCESRGGRRYFSAFRETDQLRYLLDEGPDFVELDEKTGRLTALPKDRDVSTHTITLRVQNGQGGADMQGFDLEVRPAQ
ncbi:MAG: hypothetical protein O3B73_09525 [bacterium]|jgi:hypothetical protein|nr:hypothetical protein [bacterium]